MQHSILNLFLISLLPIDLPFADERIHDITFIAVVEVLFTKKKKVNLIEELVHTAVM